MKKLPNTLDLTWHKGYKKDYPKDSGTYLVLLQNKKNSCNSDFDFAIFIKEEISGHCYDRWRLLADWVYGDIFVKEDIDSKVRVVDWASIKNNHNEK